jgi:hypothetical protein
MRIWQKKLCQLCCDLTATALDHPHRSSSIYSFKTEYISSHSSRFSLSYSLLPHQSSFIIPPPSQLPPWDPHCRYFNPPPPTYPVSSASPTIPPLAPIPNLSSLPRPRPSPASAAGVTLPSRRDGAPRGGPP